MYETNYRKTEVGVIAYQKYNRFIGSYKPVQSVVLMSLFVGTFCIQRAEVKEEVNSYFLPIVLWLYQW